MQLLEFINLDIFSLVQDSYIEILDLNYTYHTIILPKIENESGQTGTLKYEITSSCISIITSL